MVGTERDGHQQEARGRNSGLLCCLKTKKNFANNIEWKGEKHFFNESFQVHKVQACT